MEHPDDGSSVEHDRGRGDGRDVRGRCRVRHRTRSSRPSPTSSASGVHSRWRATQNAVHDATRHSRHRSSTGPERALDAFARDLALTSAQRTVADSILHHEFETANAIREESWPRMQAVMEETRRKLDSLLTPAQRERYRVLLSEQQQRFRAREGRPAFPPYPR